MSKVASVGVYDELQAAGEIVDRTKRTADKRLSRFLLPARRQAALG